MSTPVLPSMASNQSKPPLVHQATTSTLHSQQRNLEDSSERKGESRNDEDIEKVASSHPLVASSGPWAYDILLFFGVCIMLIWPWLFFGVVWAKKGIQMDNRFAKVVENNLHATTYFISFICSIISMIVATLFSLTIIRFAQEFVTHRQPTDPFHITILLALRHQTLPLGKSWQDLQKDRKDLMTKNKWWPTVLVIICFLTFPHLVSTTTSLITPVPFNRTAILNGTELDLSSTDPSCPVWFEANPIPSNCDWVPYNGQWYSNCLGENQMVDVLEAGRGNILELASDNSQTLTFSQLGAANGLHFLGSIQGVLPIGPNGVPTLNNNPEPFPFSDPKILAGITSYNYTFNHQGLASNVSCSYTPATPIEYGLLANFTLQYDVPSCAALGQSSVLTNVPSFNVSWISPTNLLMYWACQSVTNDTEAPSYSVYLSGPFNGYTNNTGNITCTIYPMQPAIYPVTYHSTTGIFSVGAVMPVDEPGAYSPSVFSSLVNYVFIALGGVIEEGQNFDSNLVAESVITFGVKSFGVAPYVRNDTYLRLYERMIQGILEYESSYIRLIYSVNADPPPSCVRTVSGSVRYEVFGWFVTKAGIGFLIPYTLINGATLVALFIAAIFAKRNGYPDPFEPRKIRYDDTKPGEEVPDEWRETIAFQPTHALREAFNAEVLPTIEKGLEERIESAAKQLEGK